MVVDASVALKWVLSEADSHLAQALAESDEELLLPDFWLNEATNDIGVAAGHSTYDTPYVTFAIATGARWIVVADGPFITCRSQGLPGIAHACEVPARLVDEVCTNLPHPTSYLLARLISRVKWQGKGSSSALKK